MWSGLRRAEVVRAVTKDLAQKVIHASAHGQKAVVGLWKQVAVAIDGVPSG